MAEEASRFVCFRYDELQLDDEVREREVHRTLALPKENTTALPCAHILAYCKWVFGNAHLLPRA